MRITSTVKAHDGGNGSSSFLVRVVRVVRGKFFLFAWFAAKRYLINSFDGVKV
ncbi:MAG: hypothetical protein FWB83_02415 [Treponema sp.]|nr:hypothetical protein [Treponema sp.]